MKIQWLLIAVVLGCGGGTKKQDTDPVDPGGGGEDSRPDPGGNMVSPDTADEIQRMFERKRPAVSRCLSIAVDSKELPKNARGKITLGITISPSGKAGEVKVIKASLESKALEGCVINKIKEIQFPQVPNPYPTTYTYAFEAM
jgi:hypothetical protein